MRKILLILSLAIFSASCADGVIDPPARCDVKVLGENILAHPRLLFTTADQTRVERLAKSDEQVQQLLDRLYSDADSLLNEEQIMVAPKDYGRLPNLLTTSSNYAARLITLSMANRFNPKDQYVAKINETLNHLCTHFTSWNPAHYLDVAEMTSGVALAYDWNYNSLPDSTKTLVVKTINKYALDLAVQQYDSGDDVRSWAKRNNNWNVICNTGMVMGALAIAEENPELTERIISESAKYVPRCLDHYAPDGTCFEGAGYWSFTNVHLTMLLRALEDNLNSSLGLAELPGVSKAAQFFISTISPITDLTFNFADSGRDGAQDVPAYFYFSRRFNQPEVAAFYRSLISEKLEDRNSKLKCFFYLGLAWYDESSADGVPYKPMQIFRGINDFVVLQGEKSDPDYIYMIAKGGDPDCSHQQLDAGTFVIDKHGERWYDDMGSDNYALPGFWKYSPDGERWNYFRNTNLCHNTLSIEGKLHHSRGESHIIATDSLLNSATIDMTSMFNGELKSANRTFKLVGNSTIEIEDRFAPESSVETMVWGGVTMTDVTVDGDRVVMHSGDKKLVTKFECDGANIDISISKAEPKYKLEKPMSKYNFIVVKLSDMKDNVTIRAIIE